MPGPLVLLTALGALFFGRHSGSFRFLRWLTLRLEHSSGRYLQHLPQTSLLSTCRVLCNPRSPLSGASFHTASQISGPLTWWAVPRAFTKNGLQKVKGCEAREERGRRGSNQRKRRGRGILLAEKIDKKKKKKKTDLLLDYCNSRLPWWLRL